MKTPGRRLRLGSYQSVTGTAPERGETQKLLPVVFSVGSTVDAFNVGSVASVVSFDNRASLPNAASFASGSSTEVRLLSNDALASLVGSLPEHPASPTSAKAASGARYLVKPDLPVRRPEATVATPVVRSGTGEAIILLL